MNDKDSVYPAIAIIVVLGKVNDGIILTSICFTRSSVNFWQLFG